MPPKGRNNGNNGNPGNQRRRRRGGPGRPLTGTARAQLKSTGLIQAVVLPHEAPPTRLPQFGGVRKTAVLKLMYDIPYTISTDTAGFICPSPTYPLWLEQTIPTNQAGVYVATEINLTDLQEMPDVPFVGVNFVDPPRSLPAGMDLFPYTPLGMFNYNRFAYWPKGADLYLGFFGPQPISNLGVVVTFECIDTGAELRVFRHTFTMTVSGNNATKLISSTLTWMPWLRIINIVVAAGTAGAVANPALYWLAPSATNLLLPMFGPIDGVALAGPLSRARCNSSSLLIQNNTAPLYCSGTIDGAILDMTTETTWDVSTYNRVIGTRNADLRYAGKIEKGLYTFTVPTQDSIQFKDYNLLGSLKVPTTTPTAALVFDLRDGFLVNTFLLKPTSAQQPQNLHLIYDTQMEFITTAQIYNLGVSSISFDEYHALLTAAATIKPYTENPVHWAALGAFVRRVARAVAPGMRPLAHNAINAAAGVANRWVDTW